MIYIQYLADTYFWEKSIAMPFLSELEILAMRQTVSRQQLCLYGMCSFGAATALTALLCQLAMPSCVLEPLCVALYFACKTCVYGFWLEKLKAMYKDEAWMR